MTAIEIAIELEKRFEAIRLRPYLDAVGVPTIGIGATYYEDGRNVTLLDDPITRERALQLCAWMTEKVYLPAVMSLCPNIQSPARLAAIIDFTFNLGSNALKHSTLRRKINAEMWGDVPKELLKWNKAGGRVLNGLTARRKAEGSLI